MASPGVDEHGSSRPSIAVACAAEPRDPAAFSGVPAGLLSGLAAIGCRPVPVAAQLAGGRQRLLQLGLAAVNLRPRDLTATDHGRVVDTLRGALRRNQTRLLASPSLERVRSAAARRALARRAPVMGVIQFGTDFRLPDEVPFVTHDDQTVAQAARVYAYPWIDQLRRGELDRLVERQREVYAAARMCCAENHWAAASIIEDYGVGEERVRVVGAGVTHVGSSFGKDWSKPRYLFVGMDWQRKNGERVLRCFREVRARHPDATLELVGRHKRVEEAGVIDHGVLAADAAGGVVRLADLYARATCLVVPSQHEPAAIVYLEAACAGTGSIATTAGGSATFVGDGGILANPDASDDILAAMLAFADPRTAQEYGRRARQRAHLFTWPLVAGRLVRALTGDPGPDFL